MSGISTRQQLPVNTISDTDQFLISKDNGDGTFTSYKVSGSQMKLNFSGLTFFTQGQVTTAPNATVPVNSLVASGSTTNVDVSIVPKGTGAFTLAIPDGTSTGGNKRGTNAVDLQMVRNANWRIASGNYSTIIGGIWNKAAGTYAIAGGFENQVDGDNSVAFGASNTTTTNNCYVLGTASTASGGFGAVALGRGNTSSGGGSLTAGFANIASANHSISLGESNTASANGAIALGVGIGASGVASIGTGWLSNTFGIRARQSHGNNNSVSGDCQKSTFPLSVRTTGNTATTLTVAGGAASTNNQVILSNNSAYRFKGTIIGKQSGSTNAAAWDVDGLIVRGANAASTSLVVGNVNLVSNAPAWGTPTLTADTTNGGLRVQVIGAAGTNIQWTAVIETTEVIYA